MKKELTKEDFRNTKWRVTEDQCMSLLNKAVELGAHPKIQNNYQAKFNHIIFDTPGNYATGYYNPNATQEELDKDFESYKDYKEMKFEDYFERTTSDIIPKVQIPKDAKVKLPILNRNELKTLKDIETKQFENHCQNCNGVSREGLKKEAIKYVKKYGADNFNPWSRIFNNIFNITEEDLK